MGNKMFPIFRVELGGGKGIVYGEQNVPHIQG